MNRILTSILWITLIFSAAFAQDAAQYNFIAADKSNNVLGDLKKEEITLLIDGKPQAIASLEKRETPLIYALAVDCSGSMRMILDDIINAGETIVNQNRKDDEALVFSFVSTDKFRGMQTFSADENILLRYLNNFYVEGGQTALIDALYLAVKKVSEHKRDEGEKYRRVVIAITDGEDRLSSNTEKALLELIRKENVQIYFIGLTDQLSDDGKYIGKGRKGKAEDLIEKISKASGGAAIFPKKIKDLPDATTQLLPFLQSESVISYTPLTDAKGKPQKIEINLVKDSKRKDVKFYFRPGNR